MSSEATEAKPPASPGALAKQAPTEQQESQPGKPRRLATGQTVCNEKNEKGKLCNGHLKEINTQHPSAVHLRGDDALHRCQTCGALYMGPPMGHVRDPRRQQRYVERDLAAILRAAGGTLPAYEYPTPPWRGEPKPRVKPTSTPSPELSAKPAAAEEAATTATTPADSSPSADAHRPAAEAQAATGQASAAPMSPTAATASPASGAETVSDLAPEASTERTPGAPKDERPKEAAAAPAPKKKASAHGFKIADEFRPQPGETPEQKIARLKRLAEEAKRAAGKL
jgi:hypothetical protein